MPIHKDFDVGALCTTSCDEYFDELVSMHPGAVAAREAHKAIMCDCGRPGCFRFFLQQQYIRFGDEASDRKHRMLYFLNCCGIYQPTTDERYDEMSNVFIQWLERESGRTLSATRQVDPFAAHDTRR